MKSYLLQMLKGLRLAHLLGLNAAAAGHSAKPALGKPPQQQQSTKRLQAAHIGARDQRQNQGAEKATGRPTVKDHGKVQHALQKPAKAVSKPPMRPQPALGTEDEDDDPQEMFGDSVAARARRVERARCAAIVHSGAACRNPVLAANLAFKTTLSIDEAVAVLENAPVVISHASTRSERNPSLGAWG